MAPAPSINFPAIANALGWPPKIESLLDIMRKKTDALQALERLSGVSLSDRFNMTFAEVYAQWSPEHFKTIGPKGVEAYENSFQIFSSLHDTKFRDLRTSDFQEIFFSH